MKKNINARKFIIQLYNPQEEGLGSYDVNYINACKKVQRIIEEQKLNFNESEAA